MSSSGEDEALSFVAACKRAEKAALRLIARAEQNSSGISVKLERRGHDPVVVKAVVSGLLDQNLLNDEKYAELWLRSRLSTSKKNVPSPRWLNISLGKRGIDRNSSQNALEKMLDSETEYALLLKFIEKNRLSEKKLPGSLRSQLKFEGFSPQTIEKYFELS